MADFSAACWLFLFCHGFFSHSTAAIMAAFIAHWFPFYHAHGAAYEHSHSWDQSRAWVTQHDTTWTRSWNVLKLIQRLVCLHLSLHPSFCSLLSSSSPVQLPDTRLWRQWPHHWKLRIPPQVRTVADTMQPANVLYRISTCDVMWMKHPRKPIDCLFDCDVAEVMCETDPTVTHFDVDQ